MKKLIFIFLFIILKANIIDINKPKKNYQNFSNLHTYKDYLNLINTLKKEAVFQPQQGYFLLGILKMQDLKLKDKIVNANFNEALYFFKKAIENGNDLAAYYYALIQAKANNIYDALNVLDNVLQKEYKIVKNDTKNKIYTLLSIEYASIILDNLRDDKYSIKKALKYLSKLNANNDIAKYLYANLYYFLGDRYYNIANYLLNSVCSKSNLEPDLKKQCETNPYIKNVNVKINCPIIKKFN